MNNRYLTITSNENIAPAVYKMTLSGDTSAITAPGQFVNLKLDGLYLRRPISVNDVDGDTLTIIYKVVGEGTEIMSQYTPGRAIDTLLGLGNGYNTALSGEKPLLIGGGVGIPPLYYLARKLIAEGKRPTAILGFNTASEVFCKDEFEALGIDVIITTVDGSLGTKGFVTAAMQDLCYTYTYSCGPEPMLKAVYAASATDGEYSFEERMGCGFGACMGCTCKTKYGNKRICRDGPVLTKGEIIW